MEEILKHIQLIYREGGETVSTLAGMEMAGVGWGGLGRTQRHFSRCPQTTGQALVAVHALQHGHWWGCSWEVNAIRKRGVGGGAILQKPHTEFYHSEVGHSP